MIDISIHISMHIITEAHSAYESSDSGQCIHAYRAFRAGYRAGYRAKGRQVFCLLRPVPNGYLMSFIMAK